MPWEDQAAGEASTDSRRPEKEPMFRQHEGGRHAGFFRCLALHVPSVALSRGKSYGGSRPEVFVNFVKSVFFNFFILRN